ncbi:PAS domain-containing protein [Oryzifoliimicrobium ureilyticus]|uniref:PAS domain-containing protein n=1 Tax=Oryzifoliimicrobium ureilyticus TaxID=3113724 RepID=UPI003075FB52
MPHRQAKSAEAKLQLLETMLGAGTWTYTVATRELYWSRGLYRLLGLDPQVVFADRTLYESLIHPDDRLTHEELVERAEAGELSRRRFRMIRPDGHLIWLESRTDRQYDRQGNLVLLQGVVQEVSEQEQQRQDHARLSTIVSSMRRMTGGEFWRTDPQGRFIDTAGWTRFTGKDAEQLRDHDGLPAVHPDDREILRQAREDGMKFRRKVDMSIRVRRADGAFQRVHHRILPVFGPDGELIEWHGMSWMPEDVGMPNDEAIVLKGSHVRAARTLLGVTARELAALSGVSFSTIRRIEDDIGTIKPESVEKVKAALKAKGIRFGDMRNGATGVSLRSD